MTNYTLFEEKLSAVRQAPAFQNIARMVELIDKDLPTKESFEALPHQAQKDLVRLAGIISRANAYEVDFDTAAEQIMDRFEIISGRVKCNFLLNSLSEYVDLFDVDAPTPMAGSITDESHAETQFIGTIAHKSSPLGINWADAGAHVVYENPKAYGISGTYEGVVVDGKMTSSGTVQIDFAEQGPYGKGVYGVNTAYLSIT